MSWQVLLLVVAYHMVKELWVSDLLPICVVSVFVDAEFDDPVFVEVLN